MNLLSDSAMVLSAHTFETNDGLGSFRLEMLARHVGMFMFGAPKHHLHPKLTSQFSANLLSEFNPVISGSLLVGAAGLDFASCTAKSEGSLDDRFVWFLLACIPRF